MATDTGTKDKYFQYFVDELQTKLNRWREAQKAETEAPTATPSTSTRVRGQDDFLQKLREDFPQNLFNPVLGIPGKSHLI